MIMKWIALTERMPNPDEHSRVLIYTQGTDFAGEQVFDVETETLNECMYENPEDQLEVCRYATHWAERPALKMNRQWNWLIGRKLSLGEVVDVSGESATVRHGYDETRVLLCELLEEDYKAQDRFDRDLNEAWNTGDGAYRP